MSFANDNNEPPWLNGELDLPTAVNAYERFWIERALKKNNGSVTRAAKDLCISWQFLGFILKNRQKGLHEAKTRKRRT